MCDTSGNVCVIWGKRWVIVVKWGKKRWNDVKCVECCESWEGWRGGEGVKRWEQVGEMGEKGEKDVR